MTELGAAWGLFGGAEIATAAEVSIHDRENYGPPTGWIAPEPSVNDAGIGVTKVTEVSKWTAAT